MMRSIKHLVMTVISFAVLSAGSVAFAHEDHNALGAGPATANSTAPVNNNTDHMEMGSMATPGMNIAGDDMAMGGMHDDGANKNKSFGQRLVSWLGRVHTMVIHFPIAMFIGAFAVELFGLWRRNRDYQRAAHVMLVVGALGAIVAAFLGWFAGGFYMWDRNPILMTHRWLGTSIAVFGIILAYLATRHRKIGEGSRTVYWVLLGLMTLAISMQGFLGGTFMHGGLDHLAF